MKHPAVKEKPARKTARIEQVKSIKTEKKVAETAAISPVGNTKTKEVKKIDSAIQKINPKEKTVKSAAVVSKSKLSATKIAPVLSNILSNNRSEKKKTISAVSVEKDAAKAKKIASVKAAAEPKIEKKKTEPAISKPKNNLTKDATISVQKVKPQIEKTETIAPVIRFQTEIQKIKSAVNIGKINAVLKAIEEAQATAAKNVKKEKNKLTKLARKTETVETKVEINASPVKTKPKNIKQIGAAVFRGRKNRYDFQVYPLDFAFENVPAIYVISKRKTDNKKRGHHALVCIGQTDSILSELKKHTKSKCVKKHQANVISILPEENEKRRLKIEEDLKAAHQIVCNIE